MTNRRRFGYNNWQKSPHQPPWEAVGFFQDE
ncbi:hypothetical protein I656_02662 [Geobacillus sp. WSUCF1]|nr:hypothetical protein I656_02662 [Geobacillus sp. WSUCF1]GAJ59539.1 hypothetical protein B23_2764 [Geobacillus thermoleovorans B23]